MLHMMYSRKSEVCHIFVLPHSISQENYNSLFIYNVYKITFLRPNFSFDETFTTYFKDIKNKKQQKTIFEQTLGFFIGSLTSYYATSHMNILETFFLKNIYNYISAHKNILVRADEYTKLQIANITDNTSMINFLVKNFILWILKQEILNKKSIRDFNMLIASNINGVYYDIKNNKVSAHVIYENFKVEDICIYKNIQEFINRQCDNIPQKPIDYFYFDIMSIFFYYFYKNFDSFTDNLTETELSKERSIKKQFINLRRNMNFFLSEIWNSTNENQFQNQVTYLIEKELKYIHRETTSETIIFMKSLFTYFLPNSDDFLNLYVELAGYEINVLYRTLSNIIGCKMVIGDELNVKTNGIIAIYRI